MLLTMQVTASVKLADAGTRGAMTVDFDIARTNMVNGQVITVGITDHVLIAALSAVPREHFVPTRMTPWAFSDSDILLKEAAPGSPARYLMAVGPFARLVQKAGIDQHTKVLDVGCATGYSSAVLARLANSVIALESDKGLSVLAAETLAGLGVENVAVVNAPLEAGWPDVAPYDVIFIGGSVETIPAVFAEQLNVGGRLIGVIGRGHSAAGMIYIKTRCAFGGRRVFNGVVGPLPGFAKSKDFVF